MPDLVLHVGSLFIDFFVQIGAAFLVCFLLARLCTTPHRRFLLWSGFLLGTAGYWIVTLARGDGFAIGRSALPAVNSSAPPHTPTVSYALWLPSSWEHAVGVAGYAITAVYLVCLLGFLAALASRYLALDRTLRHAAPPSSQLSLLFAELQSELGVRHCELLTVAGLSSPATACWRRPKILIPESCSHPEPHVADALRHELIHVARRDYLWSMVADGIRCVLFFHPAVWFATRRMRLERELACDAAVIDGRPEHRADYAESLTRFARIRMLWGEELLGIDFAASVSMLELRVRALLNDAPREPRWHRWLRAATMLALTGMVATDWPAVAIAVRFAPPRPAHISAPVGAPLLAVPLPSSGARPAAPRARPRSVPSWNRVRFSLPSVPRIDAPAPVMPRFVSSVSSNGPEGDDSLAGAASQFDAEVEAPQSAWTESVPRPQRGSSTVARSIEDSVLTGIAAIGVGDHDRTTVTRGRPR
jgi:beta-lactamase regulating signal transducer with metallopeptidase domain